LTETLTERRCYYDFNWLGRQVLHGVVRHLFNNTIKQRLGQRTEHGNVDNDVIAGQHGGLPFGADDVGATSAEPRGVGRTGAPGGERGDHPNKNTGATASVSFRPQNLTKDVNSTKMYIFVCKISKTFRRHIPRTPTVGKANPA